MIHKIDLHGMSHREAISKVEDELVKISLSKFWEVEIITGKSKYMQHRITTEVLDPLKFFHYIPHTNPGVIIVTQDDLFI
ncbi:Smr/MutS family protein [bacterium]|nr:Smr/MutS family protein [bacterium]